jgi:hypothetical protein
MDNKLTSGTLFWRTRMPGKPGIDPEYLDAPYLTLGVNLTTAFGLFVAVWTAWYVFAGHPFSSWWWLVLALVADLAANVVLRVALHRKRALDPDRWGTPRSRAPIDAHHRNDISDVRWRDPRTDDR